MILLADGVAHLWRSVRTSWLTTVFMVSFLTQGLLRMGHGPALLRWYLQSVGGGFVKAGQLLAMRLDMLPARYHRELVKLLDQAPAMSEKQAREIVERDLGADLASLFRDFPAQPAASGSIAQVHRARLLDGTEVAVKVMRAGVRRQFQLDLALLGLMARLIDLSGLARRLDLKRLVGELARLTMRELDFRREAFNTEAMRRLLVADREQFQHAAPRIHFERCGDHVITMEWFEGITLAQLLAAVQGGDAEQLAAWAERGICPKRSAGRLFQSVMDQCYHHRFFHADPHAANVLVLEGGLLGLIDFGLTGRLDEHSWAKQLRLFRNLSARNLHGSYKALMATLEPLPPIDLSALEGELKTILGDWFLVVTSPSSTVVDKSNARLVGRVIDALRRHGLQLPWAVTALYRTLVVVDQAIYTLDPDLNPLDEVRKFFRGERWRRLEEQMSREAVREGLGRIADLLVATPDSFDAIVEWLSFAPLLKRADYEERRTRVDQALVAILANIRRGTWLAVAGIVALRVSVSLEATNWLPPAAPPVIQGWWWLAALPLAVVAWLLGRSLRSLRT